MLKQLKFSELIYSSEILERFLLNDALKGTQFTQQSGEQVTLQHADAAFYQAKGSSRDKSMVYAKAARE